jgi:prophage tail gpP-like protein
MSNETLNAKIGNQVFDEFTSYSVSVDIENCASAFQLAMPITERTNFIRAGAKIQLLIGGKVLLTGIIEKINDNETKKDGRSIALSGRNLVMDLIDSTMGFNAEFKGSVTLASMIDKINKRVTKTGIKVIDKSGANITFSKDEVASCKVSDTIFEFVEKMVRQKQCFLSSDTFGNLTIIRQSTAPSKVNLFNGIEGSNCTNIQVETDITQRFNIYRVHGQENPCGSGAKTSVRQLSGSFQEAVDPEIRSGRILDIVCEGETVSAPALKKRAIWEATVRKARSLSIELDVVGHYVNGELLDVNKLVSFKDDYRGISGNYLLKKVDYNLTKEDGFTSSICLTHPDAYLAEPLKKQKEKKQRKRDRGSKAKQGKQSGKGGSLEEGLTKILKEG